MDYKKEYNERKAAVIELLRGCINFYTGLERAEQVSTLEDLESNVKNGRFSIVVVGQFSAGKSTFLNSLRGKVFALIHHGNHRNGQLSPLSQREPHRPTTDPSQLQRRRQGGMQ